MASAFRPTEAARQIIRGFLLLAFAAGTARAAQPSADDLIARGLELRRAAKPGEALEMFRRAHALSPSARTLGQMGLVEASLEHWLDADTHLAAALSMPANVWVQKNRAFLVQAANISGAHIGEVVITGPAGTDVAVDGRSVGTLPNVPSVRLVEGKAVITAHSARFKAFSRTITVGGGAKVSLAIVLDPVEQWTALAVAAPVPTPPAAAGASGAAASRSWKTPAGAGLIAAGAGLLAWGIAWIVVDGQFACPTVQGCNAVYDTRAPGWILTAGGTIAAGAGAVLLSLGQNAAGGPVALGLTPTSVALRARF